MPSNPISRVAKNNNAGLRRFGPSCSAVAETTSPAAAPPFWAVFRRLGKNPAADFKNTNKQFHPSQGGSYTSPPPSQNFQGGPGPRLHPVAFQIHASARVFSPNFLMGVLDEGKPPTTPNPPAALMAEGLVKTIGKLPEVAIINHFVSLAEGLFFKAIYL